VQTHSDISVKHEHRVPTAQWRKRVCRRDIDYALLLETGKTTAGPATTASFVGGRHLSAVADITPSKFVGGNAPPIHHVTTMPVGGMRVSDLRHEKHTDDMTLSVLTKGLHLIVKECIKKQLFRRLNFLTNASTGRLALAQRRCAV
jgi:hypothetical protein